MEQKNTDGGVQLVHLTRRQHCNVRRLLRASQKDAFCNEKLAKHVLEEFRLNMNGRSRSCQH